MRRPSAKWLVSLCILIWTTCCHARPEYAAKEKLSCMMCHATAWGGGPRLVYGKIYGSRDLGPSKLSYQDNLYADVRSVGYYPTKKITQTTSGIALMEAAVTGNGIIKEESGVESRAVLTYNIAPLSGSQVREAYLRLRFPKPDKDRPTHVHIGRFYVPFGLLTDEHRAYTRIQTNTTINNYVVGAAVASDVWRDLHFDLALVNDFQSGGGFVAKDLTLATVLNARWNPASLPFLLGFSANYERTLTQPQPYAGSLYGVLSLDRLSAGKISGSLSLERVDAKNWNNPAVNNGQINPGLAQFFGAQPLRSHSVGYLGQFKYNFSSQLTLLYRFDFLTPDVAAFGNRFLRHGAGFESFLTSNLILQARFEKAVLGQDNVAESTVLATQDDFFLMLRLWL